MVGEMVQNSQSLYSFTFTAVIVIHEYIYSHSTTKFTFKKYICLRHISYSRIYLLTFTRCIIHIHRLISVHIHAPNIHSTPCNIHSTFSAHSLCASIGPSSQRALPRTVSLLLLVEHFKKTIKRRKPSIPPCITKPMSPGYGVRQYAISYLGTSHRITMLS